MHGIALKGLKDYVVENHGFQAWITIHEAADVELQNYLPVSAYPDEVAVALVEATTEVLRVEREELLYGFGRSFVPLLLSVFNVHVRREWTALDLIANAEPCVEEALRSMVTLEVSSPSLRSKRVDHNQVLLAFESDLQVCPVVRGVLDGLGDHYGETLEVQETQCVHDGDTHCELVVTGEGGTATRASTPQSAEGIAADGRGAVPKPT